VIAKLSERTVRFERAGRRRRRRRRRRARACADVVRKMGVSLRDSRAGS